MVKTRKMTVEDIDRVFEIESQSFKTPWSKESFYTEVKENTLATYLVLTLDEVVIGFGGMWLIMDEIHITNVAVAPEHRGQGYSKTLITDMIKYAKEKGFQHMTLEVRVSNSVAIALYEKFGFESVGVRPKYYVDTGEDALVMWKSL